MYSVVVDPDGSVQFSLHRAPEEMDARDAREALRLIEPILRELEARARAGRAAEVAAA